MSLVSLPLLILTLVIGTASILIGSDDQMFGRVLARMARRNRAR